MCKAVQQERERCARIVASLYVPGHWSGKMVLQALEQIAGQATLQWEEPEPEPEVKALDWTGVPA